MKLSDITGIRLINQHISGNKLNTVRDLVSDMGAIQAQDYAMAKWAIGLRLNDANEQSIRKAIDKGDIFRTHLLRPTWHFVSAEDIQWMLSLTAPRIKTSMKSRNKQLGLTQPVFNKSNDVIKKVLTGDNHLTREELAAHLNKAKIKTDMNRASHLLMEAELDGIICSGKSRGNKLTYALLEERIHEPKSLNRDESLAKLADIYFKSRGPATVKDFAWWSGLSLTDAKTAVELINKKFAHFEVNKQTYWLKATTPSSRVKKNVFLLPAYDEYLLSYSDRSAMLVSEKHKGIVSSNGIFYPLIVVNNSVVGTWRRTIQNNTVNLEMNFFEPQDANTKNLINKEAIKFSKFLGKDPRVKFRE